MVVRYFISLTLSVILFTDMAEALELKSTEPKAKSKLVEVVKFDPSIKLDIKYATKNNFLGKPVYKEAKAFLQEEVVHELVKINKEFKKNDYGIIIFDGYRPWSVTKIFWDETPIDKRKFVANPEKGSIHNRGCAVDISLYDLKNGKEVKMPSEYDDFSEKAYPSYPKGNKEEIKLRDYLIKKMESTGKFTVYEYEWWHFNYKDCDKYPILDIPFEDLNN